MILKLTPEAIEKFKNNEKTKFIVLGTGEPSDGPPGSIDEGWDWVILLEFKSNYDFLITTWDSYRRREVWITIDDLVGGDPEKTFIFSSFKFPCY
jgi:hypothetical protein